jgi:hypothetical protein
MKRFVVTTLCAAALHTCPAAAQTLNPNTVAACVSYVHVNSVFRPYSIFDAYLAPDGWVHFLGDRLVAI